MKLSTYCARAHDSGGGRPRRVTVLQTLSRGHTQPEHAEAGRGCGVGCPGRRSGPSSRPAMASPTLDVQLVRAHWRSSRCGAGVATQSAWACIRRRRCCGAGLRRLHDNSGGWRFRNFGREAVAQGTAPMQGRTRSPCMLAADCTHAACPRFNFDSPPISRLELWQPAFLRGWRAVTSAVVAARCWAASEHTGMSVHLCA